MTIIISCGSTVDFNEEAVWLSIIISLFYFFYAAVHVRFDTAGSRVDEGDDTSGVCLELVGGTTFVLDYELTVTLTTMTGKAGTV